MAMAATLLVLGDVSAQTLIAENKDAFVVKVDRGFFFRRTPQNVNEVKRKGWAFVMAKSKEMGCTHLAGISTTFVTDFTAHLRGSLAMPIFNTYWMWERPGGGFVQVTSSPKDLVEFDPQYGSGFACSRVAPSLAAEWFKEIGTLERELRFEDLID